MLKLVYFILVYGAPRLSMLDDNSLILLDVMKVVFITCFIIYIYKVKESRNRPAVAQRFPGGLGAQIFMTFGT